MTQTLPLIYRTFLVAALLPTGFITFVVFANGVWFSPIERPVHFLFVLLLASGPFWVLRAIMLSAGEVSGRRLAMQTAAIWSAIVLYVLFVFELLPDFLYEGYQWLVT